jgi:DNA-directed RNA polymerase subunit N (RpoN/RPB10)
MDLRLATLKAVSFYLLHNVSSLNQCRKLSCVTVVCKHFASYQGFPNYRWDLTLSLLMSYIYMELLVKPEILTSYIYGPTYGNTESRLFLFAPLFSTLNQCRKLSCGTVVCKHFARYQGYLNYRWDLNKINKVTSSWIPVYIYIYINYIKMQGTMKLKCIDTNLSRRRAGKLPLPLLALLI